MVFDDIEPKSRVKFGYKRYLFYYCNYKNI